MDPYIQIPSVFEGYATIRVVWYGVGASIQIKDSSNNVQTPVVDTTAFQQLSGLTTSDGGYELNTNGESDVAALSWAKDTESPAGVCGLMLYPRRDYLHSMSPEDCLLVYGCADKTSSEYLIAMISVDSVRETKSVTGTGVTVTRVAVDGRDLGKILMMTPTVYDAAFGGLVMRRFYSQFVTAFNLGAARGGPSVVVQTMLAIFFSLKQNFVTRAIGQETVAEGTPETTP